MAELLEILEMVPIFADLPKEVIEQIVTVGNRKTYSKDSVILVEEEVGTALFVIIEGKVKVSRSSSDGKEVILNIISEGDIFGEMSILDGMNRSATVTAIEETELFILQRKEFIDLLNKHPEISIALLSELTKRLRNADRKIKALSLKDAEGKVATVIMQIADESGRIKQGIVEIEKLPLQQDLANMAGTSRETISRTIHSFAKKGLVELEGSKLRILDYEKFRETFA